MKAVLLRLALAALMFGIPATGRGARASPLPLYRLPLRVHLAESGRPASEFKAVFAEINDIWRQQAGICFEIEAVYSDEDSEEGADMWFRPEIGGFNGSYDGESILMKDHPVLAPAPHPAKDGAARTAAHELGHFLGLHHDQDDDDNLMRSKTYGRRLHQEEIARSRARAAELALPDNDRQDCDPPRFIDP